MVYEELVVLVDSDGHDLLDENGSICTMGKMEAHQKGMRHRAVSVFIFNKAGELLLQKRALDKYHSPGKWTNTCCTHSRPGEIPSDTAIRRLEEEMGLSCELRQIFTFSYRAEVGNGLIEDEFDHVFFGFSDENPVINPDEAAAWKWISLASLQEKLIKNPAAYTVWLRTCFGQVLEHINNSDNQVS